MITLYGLILFLSGTKKPMAKISLQKAMIFLMELSILTIFKTQADVLAPSSPYPTPFPIRLVQSSQMTNLFKRYCYESTFQKCESLREPASMSRCVMYNYLMCIPWKDFPTILEEVIMDVQKCIRVCHKDIKVANHHLAYCLLDCLDALN